MIKVVLADDHVLFTDGLKAILDSNDSIEVVKVVYNGNEVIDELEKNGDIDVLIIDIEMPEMDGIKTTIALKKDARFQNLKILILSMYNRKDFIIKLMEAGANGYLLKEKSKEFLVDAINKVYQGIPYFGLDILSKITSGDSKLEQDVDLTSREKEVLCLIAEAKTTKEIALLLNISEPTVNTYRRNLLQKLDFPNDKHLVRYAIKKGFVEL